MGFNRPILSNSRLGNQGRAAHRFLWAHSARDLRCINIKIGFLAGAVLLAWGFFVRFEAAFRERLGLSGEPQFLIVSGNIEAHQSVISFKTVQSRIVELPFNEGQWVKTGDLLARVESSDYAQQVKIAEASLHVQQPQLDTTK